MPHTIIEHSTNVSHIAKELMPLVHQSLLECGLFSPSAVKCRSIAFDNYVLTGSAQQFMHVTINLLQGRTDADLQSLSDRIYRILHEYASEHVEKLSLDINEMTSATYRR